MHSYRLVLPEEFFEVIAPGALDHWVGEEVPLRDSQRRIIGEATVKSVERRDDGSVSVVVESRHDRLTFHGLSDIARLLAGGNTMSFAIKPEAIRIPHQPRRDDDVAKWLKRVREQYNRDGWEERSDHSYWAIDGMLDEYRARADHGLTLDDDISQLEGRW